MKPLTTFNRFYRLPDCDTSRISFPILQNFTDAIEKALFIYDLETSDLPNKKSAEISEIGIIRVTPDDIFYDTAIIKCHKDFAIQSQFITGLNKDICQNGLDWPVYWKYIGHFWETDIICGFASRISDNKAIKYTNRNYNIPNRYLKKVSNLDLSDICERTRRQNYEIMPHQTISLRYACLSRRLPYLPGHSALNDAINTAFLLEWFVARYKKSILKFKRVWGY